MPSCGTIATLLHASWGRVGDEQTELHGYAILQHGLPTKTCNRGSQGVAIMLSPEGRKAWEAAGSEIKHYGTHAMAIRLKFMDDRGESTQVVLGCGYAPVGAAPLEERTEFLNSLSRIVSNVENREVLIITVDANASLGTKTCTSDRVLEKWGLPHVNDAGRDTHDFLATHGLCAPSRFFEKKHFHTWRHPRSKLPHQIDHFFTFQRDLKRVVDAGISPMMAVESDHTPISLRIRVARNLKKNIPKVPRTRICRERLNEDFTRRKFRDVVRRQLEGEQLEGKQSMEPLTRALDTAAKEVLTSGERSQPGWFQTYADVLKPLIARRNLCLTRVDTSNTVTDRENLRQSRRKLGHEVRPARQMWLDSRLTVLNDMDSSHKTPAVYWNEVKLIKRGMGDVTKMTVMSLKDPETGKPCKSPEENGEVLKKHFQKLYAKESSFDFKVIDEMRQREERPAMDRVPTDEEVKRHCLRAKSGKAPGDNSIPAEFLQALTEEADTLEMLTQVITGFWISGDTMPTLIEDLNPKPRAPPEPHQGWKV
uniref:Endonuclease/exonuclease/phosphatase domain-containing protein n=1 Tax=Octactis speculum TaxID=3111310 RepID=A0A7S2BAE4_9STRA|mmetsp:Transcript_2129/g.2539  ORF Transcript_2129/g.2539 Transcript_2129/m.2539 type:complete len:537 (+) Transcript_2129:376-1986(+)